METGELLESLRRMSIEEVSFGDETVLLRLDINSPIKEGRISNTDKLRAHYPTISRLVRDGAKVVIVSHQGRPNEGDFVSLSAHAKMISEGMRIGVTFIPGNSGKEVKERIMQMRMGEVAVLENIRFNSEETRKVDAAAHAESGIVKDLSSVATAYVNDAFASIHRNHASIVGFPLVLPSFIGLHMLQEVKAVSRLYESASRPVLFIMGGGKVEDAINYISDILKSDGTNRVAITGLIGTLFAVSNGVGVGADTEALRERYPSVISQAREMLSKYSGRITLPMDFGVETSGGRKDFAASKVPGEAYALDIGKGTVDLIEREIAKANTVVMRGPAGVIERDGFDLGTLGIIQAIARSRKFVIMAGGHTQRIVSKYGMGEQLNGHMSTGGGAVISLITGRSLPAFDALLSSKRDSKTQSAAGRRVQRL
ncbi:MAG: phosphoglycerate kinase [Candidatus Micrarchaeota archaeon]|nr:phosphoglycerate kinase [Candidatus Micrarchaeota archaeon]